MSERDVEIPKAKRIFFTAKTQLFSWKILHKEWSGCFCSGLTITFVVQLSQVKQRVHDRVQESLLD